LSCEERLGELDLVSLELRRLWGNLPSGRGCPEAFHPWGFLGADWTRHRTTCSALSRSLTQRCPKVSSNLNQLYDSVKK